MRQSQLIKRSIALFAMVLILFAPRGLSEAPILSPGEGTEASPFYEKTILTDLPMLIERVEITDSQTGEPRPFITAGVPVDISYTVRPPVGLAHAQLAFSFNQASQGDHGVGWGRTYEGVVFPVGGASVRFAIEATDANGDEYHYAYEHTVVANAPELAAVENLVHSWSLTEAKRDASGWTLSGGAVRTVQHGRFYCLRVAFENMRPLARWDLSQLISFSDGLSYEGLGVDAEGFSLYFGVSGVNGGTIGVGLDGEHSIFSLTIPGGAHLIDEADIWGTALPLSTCRAYDGTTRVEDDGACKGTYTCAATGEVVELFPALALLTPDIGADKEICITSVRAEVGGQSAGRFAVLLDAGKRYESGYAVEPLEISASQSALTNRTGALGIICPGIEGIIEGSAPSLTMTWTDAATGETGSRSIPLHSVETSIQLPLFERADGDTRWTGNLSPGSMLTLSTYADGAPFARWQNGEDILALTIAPAQGLPLTFDPLPGYGPLGEDQMYPPLRLSGTGSPGEPLSVSVELDGDARTLGQTVSDDQGLWTMEIDLNALFESGLFAPDSALTFTAAYLDIDGGRAEGRVLPISSGGGMDEEETEKEETEEEKAEEERSEEPPANLGPAIHARFGVISGMVEPQSEVLVEIDGDPQTVVSDETGFFYRLSKPLKEGQTYRVAYTDGDGTAHDYTITAPRLRKGDTIAAHSLGLMLLASDEKHYPVTPLYDDLRDEDGAWEIPLALGNALSIGVVRVAPDEKGEKYTLTWALDGGCAGINTKGELISPYESAPAPEALLDRPIATRELECSTTHLYLDVYLDARALMEALDKGELCGCQEEYCLILDAHRERLIGESGV